MKEHRQKVRRNLEGDLKGPVRFLDKPLFSYEGGTLPLQKTNPEASGPPKSCETEGFTDDLSDISRP
jgi:hypothetical protein